MIRDCWWLIPALLWFGGCGERPTAPEANPPSRLPRPALAGICAVELGGDGRFRNPHGIAVDRSGTVYITDIEKRQVLKFRADGSYQASWPVPSRSAGGFATPRDVALDDAGNVYVADMAGDCVLVFDAEGNLRNRWGARGAGPGELYSPLGLAIARQSIFVLDFCQRVQRFDLSGMFQAGWSLFDGSAADFPCAFGIDVDRHGAVWVVEQTKNRLRKFDSDGNLLLSLDDAGATPGSLQEPIAVAVGPSGIVLVAESSDDRVQMFDSNGRFLLQWSLVTPCATPYGSTPIGIAAPRTGVVLILDATNSRVLEYHLERTTSERDWWTWGQFGGDPGGFYQPRGIAVDRGVVYVSDLYSRVQAFSLEGDFLRQVGSPGEGEGQLLYPTGLAVAEGLLFVADGRNQRVLVFDSLGEPRGSFRIENGPENQQASPRGIATDVAGNLYVCAASARIDVFTTAGAFLRSFGVAGTGPGMLTDALDVGVLPDGTVLVADSGCRCVQRYDASGVFLGNFVVYPSGSGSPRGLHVAPDGRVFVSTSSRIFEYDEAGTPVSSWGGAGVCRGEFSDARDLAADAEGRLFVVDSGNHRIQVFVRPTPGSGLGFGPSQRGVR